ncbi:MAG: TetR family transcriptional regulator, partial [Actinomycetota bacterium]
MSPRSGRRPGDSGARDAILEAARATFGEAGYEGATIRAVARRAGVDPALVHHYFGNKEHLFTAAMELPIDPGDVVERLLAERPERLGESLLRFFLTVWESAANRDPLIGLIRAAMSNERAATMMREFVTSAILGR